MSHALEKLRRDVQALPIELGGAEVAGYVLVVIAANPYGEPIPVRSAYLPDDLDDRERVIEELQNAIAQPLTGNE